MKYERLLNDYSLTTFLKELDAIKNQDHDDEERKEKLRLIRYVIIMFQLKLSCLKKPGYRPGIWKDVHYINMSSFFGTRDIDECEKKLKHLMKKWYAILGKDSPKYAQTIFLEVSLAGVE